MMFHRFMLVRRVIRSAAGTVLAISLVAWIVSLWGLTWSHRSGLCIWLVCGDVIAHNEGRLDDILGLELGSYDPPNWSLPQWDGVNALGHWTVRVPLWLGIALGGMVLTTATLIGRRTAIRARQGFCLVCAYDLTGITGPCPECGREREARA